ncbi:MAG: hypothetical protein K0B11_22145 [Mariniphaga sp.]|nr:hypothetical protein [Mariniphaga sp.]
MDIKEQYESLTVELKKTIPFKAFPIRELVQELRNKGHEITLKTELIVKDVYNSGDITGIVCMIKETGNEALACGLTHLEVPRNHPLSKEIISYQKKRNKRIQKLNQKNWN